VALPKANRLKSRKDFQAVFQEGTRRHSSHFTLRALKPSKSQDTSVGSTKVGISVSTKVSKRAVVRNRLKRQISAAFYQLLPKLSPGWRLVVIVKPKALESQCGSQQFLQELEQLLAQIEVFDGH
jgi:ribonuclease P protein component